MSEPNVEIGTAPTLRQQAHQQLAAGTAPSSRGWGVGVEALTLLHRLASSPSSAADALKLLHELQVHQVELDLQQAQSEANEHELTQQLAHYQALYEQAPVAHFVVDCGGRIVESNRAGSDLLGARNSEHSGRRFDEFLSPDGQLPLAALLRDVRMGAASPCCVVRPASDSTGTQRWRIAAGGMSGSAIQLVVTIGAGSPQA